jgi:hypothetical protein
MYRTVEDCDTFFNVVDVWQDHWDDELHTVHPRPMAEATLLAHVEYPNKRIISHFNQPHYPFIGETGKKIGPHAGSELTYRRVNDQTPTRNNPTVWELLEDGEITRNVVWEAYKENLELAIPHVENLIANLEGKTIITSDHGNLFGERPFPGAKSRYGHPEGLRTNHLCKVPWLEIESERRKKITLERETRESENISELVTERLSDLGYREMDSK